MTKTSSSANEEREDILTGVGLALRELIQSVEAARDRAAKEQNLHPTDFACIGYLYRTKGPVSPKQIIAETGLSSGSGTALLDRLEAAGYTRRLPNPHDRRGVLIELDEKAAAEPLRRFLEIEQSYRSLTDAFSTSDLKIVASFLEGMIKTTRHFGDG